jgi:hypothetical protein
VLLQERGLHVAQLAHRLQERADEIEHEAAGQLGRELPVPQIALDDLVQRPTGLRDVAHEHAIDQLLLRLQRIVVALHGGRQPLGPLQFFV